ncbi:MAG: CPBP family intramembrane metalloprotease [Lachnospiraceae bacterium]|nr:CPBP family intramembrane metalloprotease [Lachnospiraceae bacterium]
MKETDKKLETKRILIFLGITFFITYAFSFGVIYPLASTQNVREGRAVLTTVLISALMFFPAIGVLLTRLITKEGFKNAWIHPHFKGNIKTYLLAYFGPGILVLLGTALYFLIFPSHFDPEFGFMQTTLEAAGASAEMYPMPLSTLIIVQALTAFFLGPILNFVTCFGEEWGWRGYLLPKMAEKLPAIPMLLINGIIWGLWHAPITAIGHNYGIGYPGFPFTGIAAMCGFCIMMGIFLSYVTLKTKSCIPAVLGHGAINSIAAIGIYCTVDGGNPFIGPAPSGIVGAIPFIIVAIIMLVFYFRTNK